MWPFKKRYPLTIKQLAASKPMPLCGKPEDHLWWVITDGQCPRCVAIKKQNILLETENRMAKKIAVAIVKEIRVLFKE